MVHLDHFSACVGGGRAAEPGPSLRRQLPCQHRRECATLVGSEALRARQTLWRAVFDSPPPAARSRVSRLRDGSCSVSDQTSSDHKSGSGLGAATPASAESSSAVAELQQLLLTTENITGFLDELTTLTVKVLPARCRVGSPCAATAGR